MVELLMNLTYARLIVISGDYLIFPVCLDVGGPTPEELVRLLDQCDISNSRQTTPSVSPSPSLMAANQHTSSASSLLSNHQHVTPSSQRRRGVGHDAQEHGPGAQAPSSSDSASQMASF